MASKQLFFLPPPPRSTGNAQADYPLIVNWMQQLWDGIRTFVVDQSDETDFNPANLPDPASTTLAAAQDTANHAYALANTANHNAATAQTAATAAATNASTALSAATAAQATATLANNRTKDWLAGEVTIAGGTTAADFTFADDQPDTDYLVIASAVSATGTPAAGSESIVSVTKATDKFTINVATDPGGSDSITFNFLVVRFP